jgi:exodeoxyribonuclease V alpha subunit
LAVPPKDAAPGAPRAGGNTTLEGVLERVTYVNDENAWSVVKLAVPGRHDLVTAVGSLLGVQVGENLRLRGQWVVDRRFGQQFKVESYATVKPASLVGIEKYLGSGLVPGIGKVMAGRLVATFGLTTLEVIEQHPERLTEVEGIGPVRSRRIGEAWAEQRQIKDVMLFLQAHGVSTAYAIRIYKAYGERAIATVTENPYRLAFDIWGIGFVTADRIAAELGVSKTSPERAAAGVLHVLGEAAGEGHLFLPSGRLVETTAALLDIEPGLVEGAIDEVAKRGQVVSAAEGAVYLEALHTAESGAAALLRTLVATPQKPVQVDLERALSWFEAKQGLTLAPEQRQAIGEAIASKLLVITGGPGTGKTTLVNGIIQILAKKGRRILLAAPTGRAAKRLAETTGCEAKTIHRLLEFDPKQMAFKRHRDNPLEADLVIVDEASMIDVVLAYNLLKAIAPACQLVFVGDVDQLPSVGPGSFLGDIMRSGVAPVVRLAHIFRQAEKSQIIVSAHRVNEGKMPVLETAGGEADFYFVEKQEPEEALAAIKLLLAERIPRRFGLDPRRDVQVLTPMHKGLLGAANLNTELQALLNPQGATVARGNRLFRIGDKVMQVRNNYDLDVFNGDIGRIEGVDEEERVVRVELDGRLVSYDYGLLDELVLAYACTIHKAQGSEYPCVIMPIHTQHYVMLQRNLIYTGMTRGRRLVVLVGSKRALALAVKNNRIEARYTQLARLLQETGALPAIAGEQQILPY